MVVQKGCVSVQQYAIVAKHATMLGLKRKHQHVSVQTSGCQLELSGVWHSYTYHKEAFCFSMLIHSLPAFSCHACFPPPNLFCSNKANLHQTMPSIALR